MGWVDKLGKVDRCSEAVIQKTNPRWRSHRKTESYQWGEDIEKLAKKVCSYVGLYCILVAEQ